MQSSFRKLAIDLQSITMKKRDKMTFRGRLIFHFLCLHNILISLRLADITKNQTGEAISSTNRLA